jgi:SagB-type dehydrogenase family enzyme
LNNKVKPGWANLISYVNSYKVLDPWVDATGLRTNELRYRTLSHSSAPRIAEDFLINTRLRRGDWESDSSIASYFSDQTIMTLSMRGLGEEGGTDDVPIPPRVKLSMELDEALGRRRSRRLYTGDTMPFNYLATLLQAAAGITGVADATLMSGGQTTLHFRTAPSAGGLYSIDLYLLALNVADLSRQVYLYDPFESKLVRTGDEKDVETALNGFAVTDDQISISRANVIFFLVAQPWRVMRKYGARGLRFVFMEAGSIAQNINLATAALGFGSVECASTYEDEIHEALRLDGLYQSLVHSVIIGYSG